MSHVSRNWKEEKERKLALLEQYRWRRMQLQNAQNDKNLPNLTDDNPDPNSFQFGNPSLQLSANDDIAEAVQLPDEERTASVEGESPALAMAMPSRQNIKLSIAQVSSIDIPSVERIYYPKHTQTDKFSQMGDRLGKETNESDDETKFMEDLTRMPHGVLLPGMPVVSDVLPATTEPDKLAAEMADSIAVEKPKELSQDEKDLIISSPSFQQFFERSARILEKFLSSKYVDYCKDYSESPTIEANEKSSTSLTLARSFFDEKWSKNRCVTCFDWSAQFPELLATSYTNNDTSPNEPNGICLIWNVKEAKETPEYIFHCESPLRSVAFAKFHPNLIVGGTYSGSIVLWDNRTGKRTPIHRSPTNVSSHTHPVNCLKVVGTQSSHNLISISSDGKMCSWSLDMLAEPQETWDLLNNLGRLISPTCLAFSNESLNNFIVGSDEGNIYAGCRYGVKTGILQTFDGHEAPITGIDHHDAPGPINFSHLYLTSSFDWSVKLWNLEESKPLLTFEGNGDHIYDVAWSPIHPAVFATVGAGGKLDIWNLNKDIENPLMSATLEAAEVALNKIIWAQSGLQVFVGDDLGKVWVYDFGEQLATPGLDEWQKFSKTLEKLSVDQSGAFLDQFRAKQGNDADF